MNLRGPEVAIWIVISLLAALIPIFIAYLRRTDNRRLVLLVALLGSWTCVGWLVAMVLSAIGRPESSAGPRADAGTSRR